jgi:hypothetical protein
MDESTILVQQIAKCMPLVKITCTIRRFFGENGKIAIYLP